MRISCRAGLFRIGLEYVYIYIHISEYMHTHTHIYIYVCVYACVYYAITMYRDYEDPNIGGCPFFGRNMHAKLQVGQRKCSPKQLRCL